MDAYVYPEHRVLREVLVRPDDYGVREGNLERRAVVGEIARAPRTYRRSSETVDLNKFFFLITISIPRRLINPNIRINGFDRFSKHRVRPSPPPLNPGRPLASRNFATVIVTTTKTDRP